MITAREPKHRRTRDQLKHHGSKNTRGISMCHACSEPPGESQFKDIKHHGSKQAPGESQCATRVPKHHGNLIVPRVFRTTRDQIKYQGCKSTPNQAQGTTSSTKDQGTKSSTKDPKQAPGKSQCVNRVPNHQGITMCQPRSAS